MGSVTIGEAVAWVCTRDAAKVLEISKLPQSDRLQSAVEKYIGGIRVEKRIRLDAPPPISEGEHATAQQALTGLQHAVFMHFIPVQAFGVSSQQAVPISASELMFLELRVCEDGRASCGLWSTKKGEFAFMEPLVSIADLQRLWPAPAVAANAKTSERILALLREATVDGRLKKEQALTLARERVADFGVRSFGKAWEQLPAERKFRRGERGSGRKAAS